MQLDSRILLILLGTVIVVNIYAKQQTQEVQIVVKKAPIVVNPIWPKEVKVGAFHIKIKAAHLPADKRGDYSADTLEIQISQDQAFAKQQETLVHEIFHACGDTMERWERIKKGQLHWADYEPDLHMYTEHGWIELMSPCWFGVMQENPDVVRFLSN